MIKQIKLLVLSAYYEPEIAASMYISTNLYESMAESGMAVSLFTPMPTRGVDDETRNKFRNKKFELKCDGKLVIQRVSMIREGKHVFLRVFRYLISSIILLWKGLFTSADVIFVQSTPPTQGATAALIKRLKKIPFVYNLQDIFPDSLVSTGLTRTGSLVWKLGRMIETYTYRNADKIIVISEGFKQNIMAKGVPAEKITVVHNWVEEYMVRPIDRADNKLFDKYGLDRSKFYVAYCGNIGLTQNMDMLVEVAKDIEEHEQIAFLLIGDGAYLSEIERQVTKLGLRNVYLIPFQPYEDIAHVFSLGDVGLVISKENVGQSSVPSKTWSIMSAERPVLASFDLDSELSSIITNADCGVCVQAGSKNALRNAILDMVTNIADLERRGANGRKYILANLTREAGTAEYIEVIKSVLA